LLRNDLGTLVGRYRRFCIVAPAATGPPLPLPITAGSEQKSERRPGEPPACPVLRGSRRLVSLDQSAQIPQYQVCRRRRRRLPLCTYEVLADRTVASKQGHTPRDSRANAEASWVPVRALAVVEDERSGDEERTGRELDSGVIRAKLIVGTGRQFG
jgi:hypothetical protein